jgi:hypothetical protein
MEDTEFEEAVSKAVPITGWLKRLLPHELALYNSGELQNITYYGSSSIWLEALSAPPPVGRRNVYRPMVDSEVLYLVEHGELPDGRRYQAIIEDENGRLYANKWLTGKKRGKTPRTTIVEFCAPIDLIETLKQKQLKIEDGALSIGLGYQAGRGLPLFNESIRKGDTTFRIVKIKRSKDKSE